MQVRRAVYRCLPPAAWPPPAVTAAQAKPPPAGGVGIVTAVRHCHFHHHRYLPVRALSEAAPQPQHRQPGSHAVLSCWARPRRGFAASPHGHGPLRCAMHASSYGSDSGTPAGSGGGGGAAEGGSRQRDVGGDGDAVLQPGAGSMFVSRQNPVTGQQEWVVVESPGAQARVYAPRVFSVRRCAVPHGAGPCSAVCGTHSGVGWCSAWHVPLTVM